MVFQRGWAQGRRSTEQPAPSAPEPLPDSQALGEPLSPPLEHRPGAGLVLHCPSQHAWDAGQSHWTELWCCWCARECVCVRVCARAVCDAWTRVCRCVACT